MRIKFIQLIFFYKIQIKLINKIVLRIHLDKVFIEKIVFPNLLDKLIILLIVMEIMNINLTNIKVELKKSYQKQNSKIKKEKIN